MINFLASFKNFTKRIYKQALRSIAFYPVFISLVLFLFALLTLSLEDFDQIDTLKKNKPYLFIENIETARTILSTLIASILSLTVFSFTMVMVVLSQASSNFSPRLLPGLVSNKKHQLILGTYIGTLLYATIVLISLGAYGNTDYSVGMSTTIAAILGLLCVGLFVSFIHNISSAIQIQNIVDRIVDQTHKKIDSDLKIQLPEASQLLDEATFRFKIKSTDFGYFHGFDKNLLDVKGIKNDLKLVVVPYTGKYLYEGEILIKSNRILTVEEEEILKLACVRSKDFHEGEHPLLGLIKLMEIAVRAMSPGINDPNTALDVINKLMPLLSKMLRLPKAYLSKIDNDKTIEIMINNISISQLLRTIIQPIRFYIKEDAVLMMSMVKALQFLKEIENDSKEQSNAVEEEIHALLEDIKTYIVNSKDKDYLLQIANGS